MNESILSKVFWWMCVGLLVTFATGALLASNPMMIVRLASSLGGYGLVLIMVLEVVLVIVLSARIHKMNAMTAKICFLLYAFISGISFSSVFLAYDIGSVIWVFLASSLIFALFAFLGNKTSVNLNRIGTYFLMALLAVIVCTIINIFTQSPTFDLIISIVMIIIFMGITAYDVQSVKRLEGVMEDDNLAILGALELYLDYINLFLQLLGLFGNSKD